MENPEGYDVVGDPHGEAAKLCALLHAMGYARIRGVWRHPSRMAIFVGDLVDRGTQQIRTIETVRGMVDAGSALICMGNHELNQIMFHTPDGRGGHLRQRSPKNVGQAKVFTDRVGLDSPLHAEIVSWFLDIPLWLDLPGLRVVHATWDEQAMATLAPRLRPGNRLSREILADVADGDSNSIAPDGSRPRGTPEFHAVETLLKGVEMSLPEGLFYRDGEGHERTSTRTRWWDDTAGDYRTAALLPKSAALTMPAEAVPDGATPGYHGTKPLVIGHYWMTGRPALLGPRVACVDYSACRGGPMVAYRWSGELQLDARNFAIAA